LILEEPATTAMLVEHGHDPEVVVGWATEVECESGIARGERDGLLTGAESTLARERLEELRERWVEVEPSEPQRKAARRLLRTHPLRAGDALQLSAALVAAEADPVTLELVTLDERLADAARREGFKVVPQQQV
jgi:predicted nucleic acid-binding protein